MESLRLASSTATQAVIPCEHTKLLNKHYATISLPKNAEEAETKEQNIYLPNKDKRRNQNLDL